MRRPRVYIASPISRGDLLDNVNQASKAFRELADAGFAPWCPQWSVYSGPAVRETGNVIAVARVDGCGLSHAEWLAVDLAWVDAADAVLRLPGESVGADREVGHAIARRIPVFSSVEELIGWRDALTTVAS